MAVDREQFSAEVVKDLGIYTQKVLVTLNAGGMVALLTFIANIESSETVEFNVFWLKTSMIAFSIGLIFVGLSLFVTYLEAQRSLYNPDHTDNSIPWFLIKMTGPPFLAFGAFLLGVWLSIAGINVP
ncbi:MAG: hypothetical protein AAFO86_02560 [Pseudomonadota bacterium]